MTDFAELALTADTRGLKQGERALDDLARKGDQVEGRVSSQAAKMAKSFMRLVPGIGAAVAALGAGFGFAATVREAEKFETTMFRVEAVIRATGGVAGRSADQLREQARAIASSTLESTEGVLRAQQTLLTFRNVQGDVFDRAIEAAADMTSALGGDLNSATMQLAKALENPVEGLSALTRSGTVFTQAQKDMVREMVEAGRVAEAQGFILSELEAQYGGTAQAAAQGLAGAQDRLGQSMQELRLQIAETLNVSENAARVNMALADAADFVTNNMDGFINALKAAGVVVVALAATQVPALTAAVYGYVTSIGIATTATGVFTGAVNLARAAVVALGGPLGVVWGLIGAAGAAWLLFRDNTDEASIATEAAEKATKELNAALGTFYTTAAPGAGRLAIELANNNYELANAAYAAAEAEVAKRKAIMEAAVATANQTMDPYGALITGPAAAEALVRYRAALEELGRTENRIEEARRNQRTAVTAVTGSMSENMTRAAAAASDLAVNVDLAMTGLEAGGASGRAALQKIEPAAENVTDAIKDMGAAVRDDLSRAWKSFVDRGFRDFDQFARDILRTFMRMIGQMILFGRQNPIQIGMGLAGGAGGIMSGLGNATGGLAGMANSALAGVGGMAGLGSAFMGGMNFFTSGVASGFAAGGIGGAIGGGGTAIATALSGATGGLGGLAAAAGAVALPVAAVALAIGAFRTKVTELDSGVRLTVNGIDAAAETFRKIERSRFFGLSTSRSTSFADDPNNPVAAAAGEIQRSVLDAARTLGFGASVFEEFTYRTQISLKGLSEDEKLRKVNDELAKMGDSFASLVPGMSSMNDVLNAANAAVARAGSMGGSRFESQMLMAAARRGEITVGNAGPGAAQSSSLVRLQKIEEVERQVQENTKETKELTSRFLRIFERWDVVGIPRGAVLG